MALIKKKFNEIPSDAVILTESEAVRYQMKILHNWKDPSDVFAYRYGPFVLAGASFLTGLFINAHWRSKLFLYSYGKLSTYLPNCIIPATFSFIAHAEFIARDLVLQKRDQCPICVEMRASAFQSMLGCVFPAILTPLSALALAQRYGTYDIPYVTKEPMKVLKLVKNIYKPISNALFVIFVGQALLASTVTYMENQSVLNVNLKLAKLEHELENS